MVRVELAYLVINERSEEQLVYLREAGGQRRFPIVIGMFEAVAIDAIVNEIDYPRPLTHELIGAMAAGLGADVTRVVVNDLKGDTYYAKIVAQRGKEEVAIDCRPSDAITVALRRDVPIFVTDRVMNLVAPPA